MSNYIFRADRDVTCTIPEVHSYIRGQRGDKQDGSTTDINGQNVSGGHPILQQDLQIVCVCVIKMERWRCFHAVCQCLLSGTSPTLMTSHLSFPDLDALLSLYFKFPHLLSVWQIVTPLAFVTGKTHHGNSSLQVRNNYVIMQNMRKCIWGATYWVTTITSVINLCDLCDWREGLWHAEAHELMDVLRAGCQTVPVHRQRS